MKIKNYLFALLLVCYSSVFLQAGTTTQYTIDVNGTTRTYIVYVPSIYDGSKPVPLMLNIHGFTMSDAQQQNMINFDPVADTANFITARPRGLNNAWSQATTVSAGQADRDFIWKMIDKIKADFNINPCKIYSAGFSQGSFMSQILVLNVDNPSRAPVIAAIGSSSGGISKAGNPSYWNSKNPTHPVPVLHLHGTSDNTIAYAGGGTQSPASVDDLMNFWVAHNNCNQTSTMTTCGSIDHYVWDGGDRGTRVELYKVNNGGHSAPNNTCMNSAKTIWEFCRPYCLPYLTSTTCTDTPTITSQPTSTTTCTGNPVSFAVTASGCIGTALSYQWQVNTGSGFTNLTNTSPYSGATTATLSISSATAGLSTYQYRCFVGSCCKDTYSNAATLTVSNCCAAPTISNTSPASRCGSGTVTLGATSSSGTVNWYTAATGGSSIATGNSYTTSSISVNTPYYVDATDNGCTTSTRTVVLATVSTPPTATISGSATVCSGSTGIINIALTGAAPWSFTYATLTGSTPVTNITNATYTASVSAGTYTISSISDANCSGTFSGSATIIENSAISVSTATVTCDGTNANYTVEFDITGGDATSYSVSPNAGSYTTATHYKSNAITSGSSYSLTLTDAYNCSQVLVGGTKTCTTTTCSATAAISGDATICSGTVATLTVTLTGAAPWTITYSKDGASQPTLSANASPFTFTVNAAGTYLLTAVTDNSSCNSTLSGSATIMHYTPIVLSNKTKNCNGGNTAYVLEFDISGGDPGSYNVQGVSGNIVSNHFTSNPITAGASFTLTVNDINNCSAVSYSDNQTCSAICNATANISGSATICSGTAATISIALTGTAPWSIVYAIDGTNQNSFSAPSSPFTFTTSVAGVYSLASVTDFNSCGATKTGSATIVHNTAISISNKTKTCNGGNTAYVLEFDISGGNGNYSVNGVTGNISSNHFTSNPIAAGTSYSLTASDTYNCSPVFDSGTELCTPIGICSASATISGSSTICAGKSATISIALVGTPPWTITYAIGGNNQAPLTATSSPFTFTTSTTGVYTLTSVTGNACGTVLSGSATIVQNTPIVISNKIPVCDAGKTSYLVEFDLSGGDPSSYIVSGANGTFITPTHYQTLPISASASYSITVKDAYNCGSVSTSGPSPCTSGTACNAIATISGDSVFCDSKPAKIKIACTGIAPWSITTAVDGNDQFPITSSSPTYTFTVTTAGVYTLSSVTDGNNCSASTSGIVNVKYKKCTATGIEEISNLEHIIIYPNPSKGLVNISITNSNFKEISIIITDILGSEVYTSIEKNSTSEFNKQIDLNYLARGIYYIKFNTDNNILLKKLVIQ